MTITLYGSIRSRAGRNVWLLEETGLPYEQVSILPVDAPNSAELAAVNPFRLVPALKDGDVALFESIAINLYLAKKAGGPIAPTDAGEEGQMLSWSFWAVSECEPHAVTIALNAFLLPEGKRDPAKLPPAIAAITKRLPGLEAHLQTQDYLVGNRFTVADINVGAILNYLIAAKVDLSAFPKTTTWLARLAERPAAKTVAARRLAG